MGKDVRICVEIMITPFRNWVGHVDQKKSLPLNKSGPNFTSAQNIWSTDRANYSWTKTLAEIIGLY